MQNKTAIRQRNTMPETTCICDECIYFHSPQIRKKNWLIKIYLTLNCVHLLWPLLSLHGKKCLDSHLQLQSLMFWNGWIYEQCFLLSRSSCYLLLTRLWNCPNFVLTFQKFFKWSWRCYRVTKWKYGMNMAFHFNSLCKCMCSIRFLDAKHSLQDELRRAWQQGIH